MDEGSIDIDPGRGRGSGATVGSGRRKRRKEGGGAKLSKAPDSSARPDFLPRPIGLSPAPAGGKFPTCSGGKVRLGGRLTCRPLDAIGVDLNCQNEEEGAGVHGAALLVHLNRAAQSIALR